MFPSKSLIQMSYLTSIDVAFEQFLAGSCAPYPIYAYQHDYERFLLLIEQGEITIEK